MTNPRALVTAMRTTEHSAQALREACIRMGGDSVVQKMFTDLLLSWDKPRFSPDVDYSKVLQKSLIRAVGVAQRKTMRKTSDVYGSGAMRFYRGQLGKGKTYAK